MKLISIDPRVKQWIKIARSYTCHYCNAKPGEKCKTPAGTMWDVHADRTRQARANNWKEQSE